MRAAGGGAHPAGRSPPHRHRWDESMEPARIVFVGDLHLGRRPSALPDDLDALGLRVSGLGPAEVWRRTVELAIERGAHAVVLAGDVVDREDDRFEAGRALRAGVARLVEAGIPVFAVVGNHDVSALPRVAEAVAGFALVGRGGQWQAVDLERDGVVPVRLVGWSFPRASVSESPLGSLDRALGAADRATLGVLHCDLDAGRSSYAPVRSAELDDAGFDAWLLGHVHKPHDLATRPVGYLGSMTGLDAGEPGARGPWWVEVAGPGRVLASHLPMAPIRYETVDCALDGLRQGDRADVEDDFDGRIRAALERLHDRLEERGEVGPAAARLVVARVRVRGRERHDLGVRRVLFDDRFLATHSFGPVHYTVERVIEDARPDLDLDALARRVDAPGLLARRLVGLRDGDDEARALLARAEAALDAETAGGRFAVLDAPAWKQGEPEALVALLLRAGTRELEGLLAQAAGLAGEGDPGQAVAP